MFEMDHVAVQTNDIAGSVRWYVETFGAEVLYEDKTWAFLRLGQGKFSAGDSDAASPHVAMRVSESALQQFAERHGKTIDRHRDGTTGIYIDDSQGIAVELICYPPGEDCVRTERITGGLGRFVIHYNGA
jgi:catechol 2,3-dioxygenase-like lactoylglutathione lyase family enzyme